jgi:hypothetical protein
VASVECAGKGSDNVMFWANSATAPRRTVSADQRFVVLRNPVLQ